ncbi:MAG: CFI-box-CTERM domain-containing protein [Nanoarchaeota archaeon]|nr:CFI-box-CTERM domain-containing protein [Nanoarchaeota archaeon]
MTHCQKCGTQYDNEDVYCRKCGDKLPSGCFIATACYGIESEEVNIFRHYGDNTLLKYKIGRKFVNFYYNTSPPIADFISNKPLIKKCVRVGLYPIKEMVK